MAIRNVNNPNLSPSRDLSYLIGVLKGDGSVTCSNISRESKAYFIKLAVKEKRFAKEFTKKLKEINLKPSFFFSEGSELWIASVSSMKMYKWYKKRDLDFESIQMYPKPFLRGIYESDGSYYGQGKPHLYPLVNTDHELVEFVADLLKRFNFETSIYKGRKGKFEWERLYLLGGKEEQRRFIEIIDPCIKRTP